jgi:hypothetical protein
MKLAGALLFCCALLLAGCTHVEPWQRGVLAQPEMALEPTPLQQDRQAHNRSSREAGARINPAGGGGGCGCY